VRETPIIFNSEMVRACLDGRKTVTRRPIKPQPEASLSRLENTDLWTYTLCEREWKCPYGQPGDKLWVRETWATMRLHDSKAPSLIQRSTDPRIWYMADSPPKWDTQCNPWPEGNMGKIRPSIHMPRWACRIVDDITNIRVERLQEITRSDIKAEGLAVPKEYRSDDLEYNYRQWLPDEWKRLWDSLYTKKPEYQWNANPWVWVIEFVKPLENE